MEDQKVLLLGGTGFLGTALARRLAQENREVCVVGRRAVDSGVNGVTYIRASLDDVGAFLGAVPPVQHNCALGLYDNAGYLSALPG